jgi:hypothetical protein
MRECLDRRRFDSLPELGANLRVGPDEAETLCRRNSRRWQIEIVYKHNKHDTLAKTYSKDYRVRLFQVMFADLLYNIWRVTDFLLKADGDGPIMRLC